MSRYQLTVMKGQQQLVVTFGWDPPLGHFFLQVTDASAVNEEDALVYSSLAEPTGGIATVDELATRLQELGISLPEFLRGQPSL